MSSTTATGTAAISPRELLASGPLGGRRLAMIVVATLCVLLDGIDIGVWGFIYPTVVAEWGVTPDQITTVATTGYITLALGALAAGPVADRIGRKPTLLVGVLLFSVPLVAVAFAQSIVAVGIARALACAGLGAVFPTAITLISEFLPAKRKVLIVTLVFAGFPFGQSVVGYMAAALVPSGGWQALVLTGGILGLALVPAVILVMRESVAIDSRRPATLPRAQRTVELIARSMRETRPVQAGAADTADAPAAGQATPRGGVRAVLSRKLLLTSTVTWWAYLANCTVTYVILGYLPLIMAQMGMDASKSGPVIGMTGWGGLIGSLVIGLLMTKFGQHRVVAIGLTLTAASVAIVAVGDWSLGGLLALGLAWGLLNGGSNAGMNAFASDAFPPYARGTGVSWMHSAGKLGAIVSGLLGGMMIGAGWTMGGIFVAFAIPVLIAAIGFVVLGYSRRSAQTASDAGA